MTAPENSIDASPAGAEDPASPGHRPSAPFLPARGSETQDAHAVGSLGAPFRIGEGWDTHALVPGRLLVIGGVTIPHPVGLLGHSDADVLIHAIIDALLGAAGLGDIGGHFPDTDPQFRGADSVALLCETGRVLAERGLRIGNIDSTVIAQAPKLASYIPAMRARLAEALGLDVSRVNVKAKTAENLGPVGQGLSMEARVIALLF